MLFKDGRLKLGIKKKIGVVSVSGAADESEARRGKREAKEEVTSDRVKLRDAACPQ
jgi:hypothetical protein